MTKRRVVMRRPPTELSAPGDAFLSSSTPHRFGMCCSLGCDVSTQVGLGFAAGAMFWVACFELFAEAVEGSSRAAAVLITLSSFVSMLCVHEYLDSGFESGQ